MSTDRVIASARRAGHTETHRRMVQVAMFGLKVRGILRSQGLGPDEIETIAPKVVRVMAAMWDEMDALSDPEIHRARVVKRRRERGVLRAAVRHHRHVRVELHLAGLV